MITYSIIYLIIIIILSIIMLIEVQINYNNNWENNTCQNLKIFTLIWLIFEYIQIIFHLIYAIPIIVEFCGLIFDGIDDD